MNELRAALSLLCVMVLGLMASTGEAAVGDIVTVAGGVTRDGGPAILADLLYPPDIAVDGSGKVYIVDQGHNRIRVVTPGSGDIISTFAGSVVGGYGGDGGPATSAALRAPTGLAFDGAGNLYIADQGNNRIRRVSSAGIMTTVAGNGAAGFSGDGGQAVNASLNQPFGVAVDRITGDLYFSDQGNNRIRKIAADGTISTVAGTGTIGNSGDNGPATAATMHFPAGVAFDSGTIYFSDQLNNRVRKITPDGTISAFAGDGTPGYAGDGGPATNAFMGGPGGITVRGGEVYIVDRENHVLRKVSGGIITTVSGTGQGGYAGDGGPANLAVLRHPSGVAFDGAGNIYITEQGNSAIRKITAATGIIDTFAGGGSGDYGGDGGPATNASFHMPWGVAVNGADLYISDRLNNKIRMVSGATGIVTTVAGSGFGGYFANGGDGGPATGASIGNPRGIAFDSSTGNLYIADTGNNRIRVVSTRTGIITTFAGNGTAGYGGDDGAATQAAINAPGGVALDAAGNVYIADQGNNRVRKVSNGIITTVAGNGTGAFSGDGGPATAASISSPAGVALDAAGDLYIADMDNHRIRRVAMATGIITTVAGNGTAGTFNDNVPPTSTSVYFPAAVKFDSAGNMLIVDQYNMRIRKVSGGRITTIAGNGMWDYAGDNAPATAASISYPTDIALDGSGNIFIADRINNAIRKVIMTAAPAVPGAPTGVSASAGNAQATVTFLAPASDGGSAITGYTVTSTPAGGVDSNAGSTGLSHVITGLANGTAYTFRVTASNATGTGPASAASNSVTPVAPVSVPGAPTISGVVAGNAQATVTFSAPASDGGSAITGYTVTSSPAGGVDSHAGSAALSHVITGLTNGTTYTFTVTARNAAGAGTPSAPSAGIVPVNPHDGIIVPGSGKAAPDISDVVMALRYVTGAGSLTSNQITHADVAPLGADGTPSGNGIVDLADVIIMLRRSIGVGNW